MGERGPAKTPTKLKLLRGETRESRLNREAPKPQGSQPRMPRDLDAAARAVWIRQTKAMRLTGVLTLVDSDTLRAYCEAVARYVQAQKLYRTRGPLVAGARKGELVKNPLHQVVRDNAMLIRLLGRELGFVPSAREGLHVASDDEAPTDFAAWEAAAQ